MFKVKAFPADSRILIIGRGIWDVSEAYRFRDAVRAALAQCMREGRAVRVLSDLSGHHVQCSRVSEVNGETAEIIKRASIDRYALVVPVALVRLQARRLLTGIDFQIFETIELAANYLEWPVGDAVREIDALVASTAPSDRREWAALSG
jgi:hypothetical protein